MSRDAATPPATLLWWMGRSGIGSQLNILLLGWAYALEHGWDFRVRVGEWPALGTRSWDDLLGPPPFPICDDVEWRRRLRWDRLGLRRGRQVFANRVWRQVHSAERLRRAPDLRGAGFEGSVFEACQALAQRLWNPSGLVCGQVDATLGRLGLEGPYTAMHVRRGDKQWEAPPVPLEDYVEGLERAAGPGHPCLVLTDDVRVIHRLRELAPTRSFVTTADESARGHRQSAFNAASPEGRDALTLAFLADVELARRAEAFVGTFSSNVGRFVALLRGLETSFGVDGPFELVAGAGPPGAVQPLGGGAPGGGPGRILSRNQPVPPATPWSVRTYRRAVRRGGRPSTWLEATRELVRRR